MTLVPLAVIAWCSAAALGAEALQWVFVWRTPGFQALKANLLKHSRKVDEAKEAAIGPKSLKKKEARLDSWKREAGRQLAKYNTMSGVIVSCRGGRVAGAGLRRSGAAAAVRPPLHLITALPNLPSPLHSPHR